MIIKLIFVKVVIEPDLDQDQGRAIDEDIHLMMIQNQDRKKKRKRNIKTTKEKIIKRIEKEGYVNAISILVFFHNLILGTAWTS